MRFKLPFAIIVSILVSGCSINGSATEWHSQVNVLGFVSSTDATGIHRTATQAKAADVKKTVSFPGFNLTITAKDVVVKIPKEVSTP